MIQHLSLILRGNVTVFWRVGFRPSHHAKIIVGEEVIYVKIAKYYDSFVLVDFPVVSGGAALVASSLVAGTSAFSLPSAFALLIGTSATVLGGNMVAESMCLGKIKITVS